MKRLRQAGDIRWLRLARRSLLNIQVEPITPNRAVPGIGVAHRLSFGNLMETKEPDRACVVIVPSADSQTFRLPAAFWLEQLLPLP